MLFGRRLTFAILVLASQLLLMALAISWCLHLLLIAKYGQVYSVERNSSILYTEITIVFLIILFALIIFALQCKRLWEKRQGEEMARNGFGLKQNIHYSSPDGRRLEQPPSASS